MPAHDWHEGGSLIRVRGCPDCQARQVFVEAAGEWRPPVSPICPGDDDDSRDTPRHRGPSPVRGGSGVRTRELEPA